MRKILSILVVLGLVLGMTVVATPVSAAVTGVVATLSNYCAGQSATYNVTFNISASLTQGVHTICVEFPPDTTLPATWKTGDIVVNDDDVFAGEITVDGLKVCFLVPHTYLGPEMEVIFKSYTGHVIKNPTVAGKYNLYVNTSRAPDSTPAKSAAYTIVPYASAYKFVVDFGPTYDGIAEGFIPPLQVCNVTSFNLTLKADPVGCVGLDCEVWGILKLLGSPDNDECLVEVTFNGTEFDLDMTDLDEETNIALLFELPSLAKDFDETWEMDIHLHCVCWHDLVFELWSECTPVCGEPVEDTVASLDFPVKGLQWLYAAEIPLFAKWNLVSLPFEPWNPDIEYQLSSYEYASLLMSVWHYDQCVDSWFGFPDQGLTEIVDGKAYWFRLYYGPTAAGPIAAGTALGTWWVFGTLESPPTPFSYEVCQGWNMMGFTSMVTKANEDYLWNWFNPFDSPTYGMIYGWDGANQIWDTQLPEAGNLEPGEGYWVAFQSDGYIYP